MQPRDKIEKSSWTLHESVKDAITQNVMSAVKGGQVKVETASLEKLLSMISASADEGYNRGARAFSRVVDSAVTEAERDVRLEIERPGLAKKK